MSGGRATLKTRKGRGGKRFNQVGDICAVSREGHDLLEVFVIECKFLASLHIDAWVYGYDGKLPGIWDKPLKEAETHGKIPLVIAKQNKKPALILTHGVGIKLLQDACRHTLKIRNRFERGGSEISVIFLQDLLVKVRWDCLRLNLHHAGLLTIAQTTKRERF